jgi:hypothetical protein
MRRNESRSRLARAGEALDGHLSWKEDPVDPAISLWIRDLELERILHWVL